MRSMPLLFGSVLLLAFSAAPFASAFSYLSTHSFAPPFSDFDKNGMRYLPGFEKGGDGLSIGEHFVRLTPDRQSKVGWLWNAEPLAAEGWSMTLRFRISGQGDKGLHGDGLAVWFTQDEHFVGGELHGYNGKFSGFGVVFDTYKNSGQEAHKDVAFVTNDGSRELHTDSQQSSAGCEAEFRYHEGRHDFNPAKNYSQARITFDGQANTVTVHIDEKGNGQWRKCFDKAAVAPAASNKNWWRPKIANKENDRFFREGVDDEKGIKLIGGARIGVSASTGGLADNHDVLSLAVGLEDEVAPAALLNYGGHDTSGPSLQGQSGHAEGQEGEDGLVEAELVPPGSLGSGGNRTVASSNHHDGDNNKVLDGRSLEHAPSAPHRVAVLSSGSDQVDAAIHSMLAKETHAIDQKLLQLHHHLEHTLASVNDNLKAALRKLADQEVLLDKRVQELEKRVLGEVTAGIDSLVDNSLTGRIMALEHAMGRFVDRKVNDEVLPAMRSSLDSSISSAVGEAVQSQPKSWLLPFILLGVAVLAMGSVGFNRYRYLLKKHIL